MVAEPLLTITEVSDRLKVTEPTVRQWLRDGRLTGVRIGIRTWRVRPEDLNAFLNDRIGAPYDK